MTTTDTEPRTVFRPTDWHINWVAANWGFTDLTEGELRCLWVVEQYLAESNHRFYHLSDPYMKRIGNDGILTTTFGTIDSYDRAGLAALAVAAFAAAVRVDIRTETVYYDPTREEPRAHWEPGDVKLLCWRVSYVELIDFDGKTREVPRALTDRFETEAERDDHIEFLRSLTNDGRNRYGHIEPSHDPTGGLAERDAYWDEDGSNLGRSPRLAIMLHAREHTGTRPDMNFAERHPGLDYLAKMIDRVKAGDPTPGTPT